LNLVVVEFDVEVSRAGVGTVDQDYLEGIALFIEALGGPAVVGDVREVHDKGGSAVEGGWTVSDRTDGGIRRIDIGEKTGDDRDLDAAQGGNDTFTVVIGRRSRVPIEGTAEGEVAIRIDEHRGAGLAQEVDREAEWDIGAGNVVTLDQSCGCEAGEASDGRWRGKNAAEEYSRETQ
jgi:hypothetical protein